MKVVNLFLVLLLAGCQAQKDDNGESHSSPATEVTLTTVKQGSIQASLSLSASTVYQRKMVMAAPVACYITNTQVAPGDRVSKGQTLFVLESKESRAIGDDQNAKPIRIQASHNGVVTEVMQQTGSFVPEGSSLCTLADLSSMVFELNVPYEHQQYIRKGEACELVLPDGNHLKGTLDKPLLSVDAFNQTCRYIARANHPFLPEGLVVQALISLSSDGHAHQILPKEAVQCDETMSDYWVMVMAPDSSVTKIPVQVGRSNASEVEIIEPVLGIHQPVICSGSYGLTEGSPVIVVKK